MNSVILRLATKAEIAMIKATLRDQKWKLVRCYCGEMENICSGGKIREECLPELEKRGYRVKKP